MIIQINNWGKYQKRKDVAKPWWFALSNNLVSGDPDFYDFNDSELLFWIYILSEASKHNKCGIVVHNFEFARRCRTWSFDFQLCVIKKLIKIKAICKKSVRDPYVNCTQSVKHTTVQYSTIHNILPDSAKTEPRQRIDFDSLYKEYPRKEGKSRGMMICKAQVKTQEDFLLLKQAIFRYRAHIQKTATDPRFIKHFSSFMTSWRDWLDPATGTTDRPASVNPAKKDFEKKS